MHLIKIILGRCLKINDHVLKILIVKIRKGTNVWFLPYKRETPKVLFMLCVVSRTHGCVLPPN
jgi:hypothetical protein